MTLAPGTRLLLIGDSVTDCGRRRPVGEGSLAALGDGYVARVAAALALGRGEGAPHVINMGISGDTVRDLAARWDRDVLALRPDWLSIMIGINDVWRHFDGRDPAAAVRPEEFERTYRRLVVRTLPALKRLVLMTPYYVQTLRTDPMRRRMDDYGAIVRRLAAEQGALFVDTQAALDRALERTDFSALAADRVHPTPAGHAILARAFLDGVGP